MAILALVVGVLIGLWTWAVILDRNLYYSAARKANREFAPKFAARFKHRDLDGAIRTAGEYKKSPLAEVALEALQIMRSSSDQDRKEIVNAAERAMARAEALVLAKLRRGLSTLEVVSAISPAIAFLYSHQVAIALGVLVTAPAIGFGISFRNRVSLLDIEIKNTASELVESFDFRRWTPVSPAPK